jgi:hypothetical protein
MSAGHAHRAHATWSASASGRLWGCPGSLTLAATSTVGDVESEAAAWGTACHEVSEDCLRTGKQAEEWIGRFVVTKSHRIEVDEELAETAQVYVDYVREASQAGALWIEQRFSLAALNPPFDAGGTADAVVYDAEARTLEVIDLKGGRGVRVEARENKQARTYALGAFLANPGLDVEWVKSTIVQPRMAHPDGRIRSETIHVADLIDWTGELREAWARAAQAQYGFNEYGGVDKTPWADAYLSPGDHCKFCPAAGFCPALASRAEAEARRFFRDESGVEQANTPDRLAPEEVARILDNADMIQDWLNSVRAYAHRQAEGGVVIPNYRLVEKHGREAWRDGADEQVRAALGFLDLPESQYLNAPKLRTPKQVRKALAPEHVKLIEGLSITPTVGTSLVRQDKTVREPVTPAAHKFFTSIED